MKTVGSLGLLLFILSCRENDPAPATRPDCIQRVIEQLRQEVVWNPPASVYRYDFKGQEVYYIPARCCDLPSLVIAGCDTLCAPDGGFTGNGDGRCPDFAGNAQNRVLIWQDERKK
ncbi:hypothetical protein GCM10027299_51700 [Larkinella ripae]